MAVTPVDIAAELGRPAPDDTVSARYTKWIEQARYLIGKRLGDLDALDQADLDYVVLMAVAAHAANPQNATQVDVRVDDGQVTKRYQSGTGRVAISNDLWSLLIPAPAAAGAYSIPLGAPWIQS